MTHPSARCNIVRWTCVPDEKWCRGCETSTVGPHPPQGTLRGCAYPPPRECTARSRACSPSRRRQTPRTPTCARLILAYSPFRDTGESSDGDAETSSGCLGDRRARVPSNPDNPSPTKPAKGASRRVQRLQLPLHALRRRLRGGRHRTSRPGTSDSPRLSRKPASSLASSECQAARAAARDPRAFRSLARAIVFQQLNGAAAAAIFARVVAVAAPDADPARLSPAGILSADEAAMRACGLSQRKLGYLRGLALAFTPANQVEGGGGLDDETLERASAEDVAAFARRVAAGWARGPCTCSDVLSQPRGRSAGGGFRRAKGDDVAVRVIVHAGAGEDAGHRRAVGAVQDHRRHVHVARVAGHARRIRESRQGKRERKGNGEGKRGDAEVRRERTRSS